MIEYSILKIVPDTVVDGPGLRTSVYFAGCSIHCQGCHNPDSWAFNQGTVYTLEDLVTTILSCGHKKVTLTGGNPIEQPHIEVLCNLLKEKGFNIWLYMGNTIETINNIPNVDVIVDGPFIQSLKDLSLPYRGSKNQRILSIEETSWQDITDDF